MKYKFAVTNERVKFLIKELEGNIEVIEVEDNYTRVEITIDEAMDVLRVFHAGVNAGLDIGLTTYRI